MLTLQKKGEKGSKVVGCTVRTNQANVRIVYGLIEQEDLELWDLDIENHVEILLIIIY